MKKYMIMVAILMLLMSCSKESNKKPIPDPVEPTESISGKVMERTTQSSFYSFSERYKYFYNNKGKLENKIGFIDNGGVQDTSYTERYQYNGKAVIFTSNKGGSIKQTFQLNNDWLAESGVDANDPNGTFSFTYNAFHQLLTYTKVVSRSSSTQTFLTNWYYTSDVCDSMAVTTEWAGNTYRTVDVFEYETTKLSVVNQEEEALEAEIFGKQRLKYALKKVTRKRYGFGVYADEISTFENTMNGSSQLQMQKRWSGTDVSLDPLLSDSYTYY